MFTRIKEYINSGKISPDRFIKDQDYCNSELLLKLDNIKEYELYTISKYEHRIDLLSYSIYGSTEYSWILLYINRVTISELKRGTVLKVIPKSIIDNIINNL